MPSDFQNIVPPKNILSRTHHVHSRMRKRRAETLIVIGWWVLKCVHKKERAAFWTLSSRFIWNLILSHSFNFFFSKMATTTRFCFVLQSLKYSNEKFQYPMKWAHIECEVQTNQMGPSVFKQEKRSPLLLPSKVPAIY